MSRVLRLLTIGHSYTIAMNRALIREVARHPSFEITVAAPNYFKGDLQEITLDPEPSDSKLRIVGLDAQWSGLIHIFKYQPRALSQLIREGSFDIVHAWEEPYIYAGYQIAHAIDSTPIKFCFRTAQNIVKWYPPPFGCFERAVRARSQGWIAGGHLVHQAMLRRGYPIDRGCMITLAVDSDTFQPLSRDARAAVIRDLGLTPPIIGFVGRLTEAKGLKVLMQALESIGSSTPWSLLLIGSGPLEERINEWARKRGWADRVRVKLVKHQDVPRYLGAMDLLVAPSQTTKKWQEQFGRMVIEAFACGVPVIGSNSGELPYVIADAGQIVPESDVLGWAHAIQKLIVDERARAELASKGLERVKRYSVAEVAAQYRNFYQWLALLP